MKKVISILLITTLVMGLYLPSVSASTALSATPVIHLTFDGDLNDTSGNAYNGSAPDANVTYEEGVIGKAARVDSAMITLLGSNKINFDKEFSFSCWVKLDASPITSYNIISSQSVEESSDRLAIAFSYGDTHITTWGLFQDIEDTTYSGYHAYYQDTYIEPEQNKDRYMHLAIVYNGTTCKYYLDGKLDGTTNVEAGTTGAIFGTGKDFIVGGYGGDTYFHGYMDDLYMFDKAIPFSDITALYSAGVKTLSNKIVLTLYSPNMMVNGTQKEIDPGKGTSPIVNDQNRTICPVRAIIEAMGGTIAFDGKTQMATLTKGSNVIKLWIGKDSAEVNGVMKEIDPGKGVVPELINNRTMLPIRFILKELGLPELNWNNDLKTITIQY